MATLGPYRPVHAPRQRGAAAIELSLAMCVSMLVLAAVVGYGMVFWAQQRLSYAAGEGARAVLDASARADAQAPVSAADACAVARRAAGWLSVDCVPAVRACAWDPTGQTECVSVSVSYETAGLPLVGILRLLGVADGTGWMPARLAAQATVQVEAERMQ